MSQAKAVTRFVFGSTGSVAGTLYGTIVVLAVLAAGGRAFQHDLWRLIALVVTTVIVLWLAHVYAHGLAESLQGQRRLSAAELGAVTRRELAIPLAAVAPTAALVLGAAGVLDGGTALWLAFGLGVATLGIQGLRYAALEHLGLWGTVAAVTLNLVLGLVLVGLEVVVSH